MFIGRTRELEILNKLYLSNKFEFLVMYGRRRVGKTKLLSEFCKNKNTVFFVSEEYNDELNLEKFTKIVLNKFEKTNYTSKFDNWIKLFEYIRYKANGERLILVIDEFPYIAESNKSILSILQNIIDHEYKESNIFLILCGSQMSFMEERVLSYKSPLFGRKTSQLKVIPLNFYDSIKFFDNYSFEDKVKTYSILGGVPHYLIKFNKNISVDENILENILATSSYLYDEPTNLMKQEMREPALYNSIIEAIATGSTTLNEISTKVGETTDKISLYLKNLQKLNVIRRLVPVTEKENSRKSIYQIEDNLFKFFYKFVITNNSLLEQDLTKDVLEEINSNLNNYLGHIFEDICKDYLIELNKSKQLPFLIKKFGKWWGTNNIAKRQEEIDILGINKDKCIFAECKYRNEKVDKNILDALVEKSNLLDFEERHYYIFSKSGFSESLLEHSKKINNVYLISTDMIELIIVNPNK